MSAAEEYEKEERDHAEMFKESGNFAFNAGHWEAAITYYSKALESRPGWGIVYSNRSHALSKLGRWWKGFYRLGEALMRLERFEEAHSAFRRSFACRSCPELIKKLAEARQKADPPGHVAPARAGAEVGYAGLAAGAVGYAELAAAGDAMRQGRWGEALRALDACAGRDCVADMQKVKMHTMRAAAHMHMGDSRSALRAADSALALDPLSRTARVVRGKALVALGRYHESLSCLDAADAIEEERLRLGPAFGGGGAGEEAVPGGGGVDELCAAVRAVAEAEVEELVCEDGGEAKARGNAAFNKGTYQGEELVCEDAGEAKARGNAVFNKGTCQAKARGNVAFNKGTYQEAIEHYSVALLLYPEWAIVYSNRSCSRLKLLQLDEALDDAEKGVFYKREWWKAHMRLGEAWAARGHHERALQALSDARDRVSGDDERRSLPQIRALIRVSEDALAAQHREEFRRGEAAGRCAGGRMMAGRKVEEVREEEAEEDGDEDSEDLDAQELSDGARERAEAALAQRHYDVAIDHLSYALTLARDSAELYALRCEAYMAKAE
ncbi:hypothetical protein T484DRAFT_1798367, partial [Baffinella frigidus]